MTGDYEALLAAVLAAPADDAPRLVLADWLEENATRIDCRDCGGSGRRRISRDDLVPVKWRTGSDGRPEAYMEKQVPSLKVANWECQSCDGRGWTSDGNAERAEFIRVSIAGFRFGPCDHKFNPPASCAGCLARRRERDTFYKIAPQFSTLCGYDFGPVTCKESLGGERSYVALRRGFPWGLALWSPDWLVHGPNLVRAHPIERVTLTDKRPWVAHSAPVRLRLGDVGFFRPARTPPPPLAADELPEEIWRQRKAEGWRFGTEKEAVDALSAAALQWARNPEG